MKVFEEIEVAKRTYGGLNTIVMNAVLEACVHCGDIDSALKVFDEMSKSRSCRVDNVSYATLLKVSGSMVLNCVHLLIKKLAFFFPEAFYSHSLFWC